MDSKTLVFQDGIVNINDPKRYKSVKIPKNKIIKTQIYYFFQLFDCLENKVNFNKIISRRILSKLVEVMEYIDKKKLDEKMKKNFEEIEYIHSSLEKYPLAITVYEPRFSKQENCKKKGRINIALYQNKPNTDPSWKEPDGTITKLLYNELWNGLPNVSTGCNGIVLGITDICSTKGLVESDWFEYYSDFLTRLTIMGYTYKITGL